MKRTKRYGGFLVGDEVITKVKYDMGKGRVVDMRGGFLAVRFDGGLELGFMPNQLINLTRFEDDEEYKTQIVNKILSNVDDMVKSNVERLCTLYPFKPKRKLPTIHFSPSDVPKEETLTNEQLENELGIVDKWWEGHNLKVEIQNLYTEEEFVWDTLNKFYYQLCTNIDMWCVTLKRQLKERIDEFKSGL